VGKGDAYTANTITTLGTDNVVFAKTSEGNTVYTASSGVTIVGSDIQLVMTGLNGGRTAGDLPYASGAAAISWLTAAATGNVLLSGGAGTAPSWGKVGLTTHVSGTLPVANGGTGGTTPATARTGLEAIGKASGTLTGGANDETVAHTLGTRLVDAWIANPSTPWETRRLYFEPLTTTSVKFYAASGNTLPAGWNWVVIG
jgi:hypothetical protein